MSSSETSKSDSFWDEEETCEARGLKPYMYEPLATGKKTESGEKAAGHVVMEQQREQRIERRSE
jgi:hypothetical protein